MNFNILKFETVGSTNSEALDQARRGGSEGLCVVADQQTAGRGRLGRTWISPADAGLYLSLILRPKLEMRFLPLITLLTSVAVAETLTRHYGLAPDIKWANDVHIKEKKVSGILAETTETPLGLAVIIGVGINLVSAGIPDELAATATSIESETGQKPDKQLLLDAFLTKFAFYYEKFTADGGPGFIRREWTNRSSYASGKLVRAVLHDETLFGRTCGIEENGALRLETESGQIRLIQAGDVHQIRKHDEGLSGEVST